MQTEMYLQVEMREKVVAQLMVIVMDNAWIDWNAIQMGTMPFNAGNVIWPYRVTVIFMYTQVEQYYKRK